jgi:hypothetical protein
MPKMGISRLHWEQGLSWEETGAYEHVLARVAASGRPFDGCRDARDVVRRYTALDEVYDTVRAEGRLRCRDELGPGGYRERGGIYVHVDRDGNPIFGGGGTHRLAMALILGLRRVPAQLGVVHPRGIAELDRLRSTPSP